MEEGSSSQEKMRREAPKIPGDVLEAIGRSFRKSEAAIYMGWSTHQLLLESQHYEETASDHSDMWLPSSPRNGLYRMIESSRRHRWLVRDLDEYRINEHRERRDLPLACWRKHVWCDR